MEVSRALKEHGWAALGRLDRRLRLSARVANDSNAILTYHSVGEPGNFGNVSPERLRQTIRSLQDRYDVVDLPATLEQGAGKRVAVTFDDGFENFYTQALPVLEECGVPATVFVVSDYVGGDGMLSSDQLEALVEHDLVTVGNHTKTHPLLPRVGPESTLREQIVGARNAFADRHGIAVDRFSYPRGAYDRRSLEIVRESHDIAVSTVPRVLDRRVIDGGIDRYRLPRFAGHVDPARLKWELTDLSSDVRNLAKRAGIVSR